MRQNHLSPALLCGVAAAVPAACAAQQGAGGRESGRPNIVYIMTDDHTAQMMSCYDTRYASTPNLDRIAAEGVRFTNSFVANSLSGPSRACMLTGKHSHKNGFYDNTTCVFDNTQQTFPKLLQQAGYETAVVGKWHLESLPTGFDHWEIVPGQGDYYNPDFIRQTGDTVRSEGYITNLITDKSLDWLRSGRDPEKPFCLLVHHKAQHRNWMADTCNLALYEELDFPLPDTFFDDYEGRPAAAAQEMSIMKDMDLIYDLKMWRPDKRSRLKGTYEAFVGRMNPEQRAAWDRFYTPLIEDFYRRNPQGRELAQWKFTRYMRDYMKVLKSLDDNVGRLLDYLDESGLAENTLVVYTSDQGFYMGEHGWFDKRFMYEESFRTPLIMAWRGHIRPGTVCRELVQNIDYAPTLLDAAGVEIPDGMDGVSLQPLFRSGKARGWRRSLYYQYYDYPAVGSVRAHYGIRTDRYKLIHWFGPGADGDPDIDFWELYDLRKDPCEVHNVYEERGYLPIRRELARLLAEKRGELGIR